VSVRIVHFQCNLELFLLEANVLTAISNYGWQNDPEDILQREM
jgi:hypothetical protein